MKKHLAIALAGILSLNALGYYGVFLGMRYKNHLAMMKALDADNYDPSREITIKVPVSIPYMPDQPEFVRVNGQFEHEGQLYRMAKQRYAADTLTIVCVEDTEHKKINDDLADYVKTFSDKGPENTSGSKTMLNFLKDYLPTAFSIRSLSAGWGTNVIHHSPCGTLLSSFSTSITHPPEKG